MSVEAIKTGHPDFSVSFSNEDKEWVATTPTFPSLSWLDSTPTRAMAGLARLVNDVHQDLLSEARQTLREAMRAETIADDQWVEFEWTDDPYADLA